MTLRILVPLDGSPAAEAAFPEAERIAGAGAEIHLLHVVPFLALAGRADLHDPALSYLERLREGLPERRGLDLIRTGDPADAILQVALELNIDLIAMATHARTGLAKWILGSVAETIVRRAQLPVLLMRPGLPPPRTILRRILVPLDGSEESFSIMTSVKRLALRSGAEVVLLHVTPRALASTGAVASGFPEDPEQTLLSAADRLDEPDLVFWQVMAEGDAVEEVLNQAKMLDADIIAMSTHARSGRDRTIFGSVAQAVLGRADRAVLLQKPVVHAFGPKAQRDS